jgi:apolipoprotein D and lipocalin family protein
MTSIRPFCAVLLALSLAAPPWPPVSRRRPAPAPDAAALDAPIDLKRFMGTWYVIGRVPNFIERGHVASVNEYELRDEHKVGITYRYRDGFGEPLQEVRAAPASIRTAATTAGAPGSTASCRPIRGCWKWRRTILGADRLPGPRDGLDLRAHAGHGQSPVQGAGRTPARRVRREHRQAQARAAAPEQVGKLGYEVPNVR